ncbi:MAG: tetratricopeptide repeat protein [Acidobacteriota bacterium]|nr:tetratricopeptide repeat protein [Acidobacteriota bacterium]
MKTRNQALGALLIVAAGFAGLLLFSPKKVTASSETEAAAAARKEYNTKVVETYDYHFGKGAAFLPSNATTDTGEFLDPKLFLPAAYCGHCHQESHKQWRESAHSNANRVPYYLRNVALLNDSKGVEYSRHCEGCHDPVALFAGVLTGKVPKRRPFDQDGVTCTVCHSIQKVDTRGTGSYVMGVPAVLVDEDGAPMTRKVSDAEILAHLDRHSKAVMKDFYRGPEFCGSCHKAALPHSINDYKWQRAFSVYDEWQNSSFAKQSPLPFYGKDSVSTCQTCHMQREALQLRDPGAKKGELASHRWLGANTSIPKIYGFDEQAARIVEFLKNGVFNVDIFAIEHGEMADGAAVRGLSAPLGLTAFKVAPGETLTADVVIQNKGIAHSHVPEQRDMYESWVEFTVKDASGKVLHQSGFIKPNGDLDETAHSFTNRLINAGGTLNDLHQVWANRVVAYNNTIQSGRSQLVRYTFQMPSAGVGPVTITAAVRYRRFDQHFMDFGMGKHFEQPVVDMASQTRTLVTGENKASTPGAEENKAWMRWNNFGIALLDAQQYAGALAAFEQVAKLRPDYADVYTNMAIVEIQWQRYDDARPHLEKALDLTQKDDTSRARALYYRALVERNMGETEKTIADLQQVIASFPESRDAHRELGFTYYQLHNYDLARVEYEKLQGIDPDDLAAHYTLSILYRRLGLKDRAREQAAIFADQKDDPTASTYALEYLTKHPEIANESVVWHTHELDLPLKPGQPAPVITAPSSASMSGSF